MIAIVNTIDLRDLVWYAAILLLVGLTCNNYVASPQPSVVFQLEPEWGNPARITVQAGRGNGGIVTFSPDRAEPGLVRIAFLSQFEVIELRSMLKSDSYRQLSSDPFRNLGCDARYGPCDEDIYIMNDWANGSKHTVECFSEEDGVGKTVADWLLKKVGTKHEYHCS